MIQTSVIIPCYNEEKSICALLDGLRGQSYPLDQVEIVISDGMSHDQTRRRIAEYQLSHPEMNIQVIDNPTRTIPGGLNRAIQSSHGEYIIRLDAHSKPDVDYIRLCIQALEDGKGANVGGIWLVRPGSDTWVARSIAQAGSHPLGVGDARYRFTSTAGYVETVPFGAYRRDLLDRIGPYDETLLANEDYELNTRILKSGGKIWLDPAIRSEYFARSTFADLARQYWRYGRWKAVMLKRYPETLRLRQFVPPAFVLGMLVLAILSFFNPFFFSLFLAAIGLYAVVLILTSAVLAYQKQCLAFIIGVPAAVVIMHVCWGSGLLWSFIQPPAAH